jgi:hypothetical protein
MDHQTKKSFLRELAAVCKKYNVLITSGADAADDTNLSSWIEVCQITKRPGRWPLMETIFECDEIGTPQCDICPKCGKEGGEYTPTFGECAFC